MTTDSRGRAKIGVLVPFTNTNLEADLTLLRPAGVSLHYARLGGYDIDEIPDSAQMAGLGSADIDEPLRLLAGTRPDVILYGCTSATLTHGVAFDAALASNISQRCQAHTVTAAGALVNALAALQVGKIAFASPYTADINEAALQFLQTSGFQIASVAEVNDTLDNHGQASLTPDDVFALGCRADSAQAQALVLSCTDMRSVETIARLEQAIGKPVVTSNQAMIFQALQKLALDQRFSGYGRLLQSPAGQ